MGVSFRGESLVTLAGICYSSLTGGCDQLASPRYVARPSLALKAGKIEAIASRITRPSALLAIGPLITRFSPSPGKNGSRSSAMLSSPAVQAKTLPRTRCLLLGSPPLPNDHQIPSGYPVQDVASQTIRHQGQRGRLSSHAHA